MVYYVYILASRYNGTLYIGITRDLIKRVFEHKKGLTEGFTKRYKVFRLVYFERYNDAGGAILREKQLKKWRRQWKVDLINSENLRWKDLYEEIIR